jgi:sugar phosphate permease
MSININTNKNENIDNFDWSKLIIISLTTVVTGIYRDGFSAIFPFLQRDFDLSRSQLGLHSTFFFFSSAIFAIFAGRLVDLKGSKWGLGFGMLFTGIFFLLHSILPNFTLILIISTFTGFAVSINIPSATKSIIGWFARESRGTALGILSAALPTGGILGAVILPFLAGLIGWRKAIFFPSALAISCAFFILYFYQDKKIKNGNSKEIELNSISLLKSINHLVHNIELLSISIFGFFLGATSASIAAHFTLFLYLDYDLIEHVAGIGFAFVQFGSFFGRVGWGLVCDKLFKANKRKTFLYIGLIFLSLSLVLCFLFGQNRPPVGLLFLLSFFIGFSGRGWTGLYLAGAAETVCENDVGIATGFSLLFMRLGAMFMPPVVGYIADLKGAYNLSWFLLGFMMFLTSLIQYIFYLKVQRG